jgi:hypothetical protein
MIKRLLVVLLSFLIGVVIFMPKVKLYSLLNSYLSKERVHLKEESLHDRWFYLDVEGLKVYYDGVESLDAGRVLINPWIVYNSLKLTDVRTSDSLRGIVDFKAKEVVLRYHPFSYKVVNIKGKSDYGEFAGEIDLLKRSVKIVFESPGKKFYNSPIAGYFKKSEEGEVYETEF